MTDYLSNIRRFRNGSRSRTLHRLVLCVAGGQVGETVELFFVPPSKRPTSPGMSVAGRRLWPSRQRLRTFFFFPSKITCRHPGNPLLPPIGARPLGAWVKTSLKTKIKWITRRKGERGTKWSGTRLLSNGPMVSSCVCWWLLLLLL